MVSHVAKVSKERRAVLADDYARRTDRLLAVLALVFLVALTVWVAFPDLSEPWWQIVVGAQVAIWLVFLVDIIAKVTLAPRRGRWVLTHPIDVLAVLLPAFRPLKVLSVIGNDTFRGGGRGLLRTGQAVAVAAGLLVWVCAVAVLPFERGTPGGTIENLGDAFWWALVTVTGVGYGDLTPVTGGGRIIGVLLMFVGLSLIGIITATVAAWFISSTSGVADEQEFNRDTEAKARLIILERKLDQLLAAQGEPTTTPQRSEPKAGG